MRYFNTIAFLGIFFLIISCNNSKTKTTSSPSNSSPKERVIDYNYTGELTEEDLINSTYTSQWFVPRKEQYVTHQASMKTIKQHIDDFEIIVYMGTWCPDSHAEMPRFFKILDETNYNRDKLTVYTLDENLNSDGKVEKGKNITNVPTIIFYKDGKEVNRFVESPRESLARDIAKIVSGKPYKHIYQQ